MNNFKELQEKISPGRREATEEKVQTELKKIREECEHNYEEEPMPNNYDYEQYECTKCGHRYKLYYDEMR